MKSNTRKSIYWWCLYIKRTDNGTSKESTGSAEHKCFSCLRKESSPGHAYKLGQAILSLCLSLPTLKRVKCASNYRRNGRIEVCKVS